MKKVLMIVKRIVLSFIILYSYNLIAVNFNLIIPINVINVLLISFLGVPSLVALILFRMILL